MRKIVVVDTAWPINSRTKRFVVSLKKSYDVTVIAWNRGPNPPGLSDGEYVFSTNIGYGAQLKKLLLLPLFAFFCTRKIVKIKPAVIIASHWDSLVSVVLYKLFFNREVRLVYDCLDMPTHRNKYILRLLLKLEGFCLGSVSLTIFASRYFACLYKRGRSVVFENYPSNTMFDNSSSSKIKNMGLPACPERTVSWIGVVRYYDVLLNLVRSLKSVDGYLLVFGDGPDFQRLSEKVKELGVTDRVSFFGRYESYDLPYIYEASNIVWAAYPTDDRNAIYAISNKYFECSLFGRRPIFSDATMMIQKSLKDAPGVIAVNERDVTDITNKLKEAFLAPSLFKPYEEKVFWEDREKFLLHEIEMLFPFPVCSEDQP